METPMRMGDNNLLLACGTEIHSQCIPNRYVTNFSEL